MLSVSVTAVLPTVLICAINARLDHRAIMTWMWSCITIACLNKHGSDHEGYVWIVHYYRSLVKS